MVNIKLMSGKKTKTSKQTYFFGYRKKGVLMQVGPGFRTKTKAKKFGERQFGKLKGRNVA